MRIEFDGVGGTVHRRDGAKALVAWDDGGLGWVDLAPPRRGWWWRRWWWPFKHP